MHLMVVRILRAQLGKRTQGRAKPTQEIRQNLIALTVQSSPSYWCNNCLQWMMVILQVRAYEGNESHTRKDNCSERRDPVCTVLRGEKGASLHKPKTVATCVRTTPLLAYDLRGRVRVCGCRRGGPGSEIPECVPWEAYAKIHPVQRKLE